ncbi:hypothetical protein GHT07_19440 [Caenimonas koreensis DSM 17982]|uniref:PilZ domain-containing protein n=1 Tax=Caenimonas koreensis DSM 17982 TaxID=1121255 RepID=A0A844B8H2_9BURK|nr:hypothetical protein [Caenimonas koreensis]MRD49452.1 hypothetical protein [Caenimonas koreensis DSM 17982]
MKHGPVPIEATFTITGRGLVAVVSDQMPLSVGKRLRATIILPNGERREFIAWKEWLLRRQPVPHEKDAFLLVEATTAEVPNGSSIEVADDAI